jgi:hypothetical protein
MASKSGGFTKCCLAVENSWNANYVGRSPLKCLATHISKELDKPDLYGRYCPIIQSSGMGKSRLLDEFSKQYFMIPVNLHRGREGSSYQCYLQGLLNLS